MAWTLSPGSSRSSDPVVSTCPRWSLLHIETSLLLRTSWTWWHDLQLGHLALLSHYLPFIDQEPGALPPPTLSPPPAQNAHNAALAFHFSDSCSFFTSSEKLFPWSPPSVSTTLLFISLFSSCCSQNFKFIFHLRVCLSNGFLFYNTVSHVREHGWLVCIHSMGFSQGEGTQERELMCELFMLFIRWKVQPVSSNDVKTFVLFWDPCCIAQGGLKLIAVLSLGYHAWLGFAIFIRRFGYLKL